jgi:hypothetical protein
MPAPNPLPTAKIGSQADFWHEDCKYSCTNAADHPDGIGLVKLTRRNDEAMRADYCRRSLVQGMVGLSRYDSIANDDGRVLARR